MRRESKITGIGAPKYMVGASNFVAKRVPCEEMAIAGFASASCQYNSIANFHDQLHNASKG